MNPAATRYRFHAFELDARESRLQRGDTLVAISPKALDLLLLLVRRPASLITKDEIVGALWPDVAVTDNALTQIVSDLRQALADNPATPQYIETVPRRGYRFIAPVEAIDGSPLPFQEKAPASSPLPAPFRAGVRETASLAAHRAFRDGREKLERIDVTHAAEAIQDFERALAHDPRYALAHVGLAHARFWLYEASRIRNHRDNAMLTEALADAHHAIDLDPDLPEAYAALALMLVSADRPTEAVAAGRRAVALEPGNWRNHCRLGLAAWGAERLEAFDRVQDLYPEFAYAYYGQAMVHIARGDLDVAEKVLRRGLPFQDQGTSPDQRLPARGLHWLLGLTRLAAGDVLAAREEFQRELMADDNGVYSSEFVVNALDGLGFAAIASGGHENARDMFARALDRAPEHPRSLLGLALANGRLEAHEGAATAITRVVAAIDELRASRRAADAALALSCLHVVQDRHPEALATLHPWLSSAPAGFTGWMIPIDPFLTPLRAERAFRSVLDTLRNRAK